MQSPSCQGILVTCHKLCVVTFKKLPYDGGNGIRKRKEKKKERKKRKNGKVKEKWPGNL